MRSFEHRGSAPILTVIISTHNRGELLARNLRRMLSNQTLDVVYIVGDNGSTDNTRALLEEIVDPRLQRFDSGDNLGFENFWLLSAHVQTAYFMFLNDRDYIDRYDLAELCSLLRSLQGYDFLSCESGQTGEYGWRDALDIYFHSRHPGTLIYCTDFIRGVMDLDQIEKYLRSGQPARANNYLVFQILQHVSMVYVYGRSIVRQPPNRERIKKCRREYYDAPYISVEYREEEFRDWLEYAACDAEAARREEILLAVFKDSLMTVTWEFYISMKIPGFAKRNNYTGHSYREWLLNGLRFTGYAVSICGNGHIKRKGKMLGATLVNYGKCLMKLAGA